MVAIAFGTAIIKLGELASELAGILCSCTAVVRELIS